MDFLKNLAVPQSSEHFHLILLISALSSLVFVPYVAFVFGSSVLSYWYNAKGKKENNEIYQKFAKVIIDVALYNKSVITFLAIIPGLVLVLIYAQMFQSSGVISVGLAGFGFLFLAIAFVLLYTYKYTFRLQGILELVGGENDNGTSSEVKEYRQTNTSVHIRSGKWGLVFLIIAVFLYTSAMSIATNPSSMSDVVSIFDVLISFDAWLKFLLFLTISVGITGIGILYFFFVYEGKKLEMDEQFKLFVQKVGRRLGIVSMLFLPSLILLNVFSLLIDVLSGTIYLLAGVSVVFFFLAAHFLYGYFKLNKSRAVGYGLVMFLSATALMIVNDHVILRNATKEHAAVLAVAYDKATEDLKSKLGITLLAMTGEDIYNAKCSACHLFNEKKVGPPYNETIPKYNGDKAKIIAFVMNPSKINPAYPPMPNQGLKPAEADSIVSYILKKIGK